MSTILEKIIAAKRKEIEEFKPLSPIARFETDGFFWNFSNRSLKKSLLSEDSTGIIAEFKRKSPSKGWFVKQETEVESVVVPYNQFGAAAISVLTDTPFFGGDLDDLIQTKVISDVPVLRKDFMIDPWQIAEAKAFGADVILLIAACLTPLEVKQMAAYANSIGLEVLLELHDETELEHICDETSIIGINNRNLKNFEVDIERSLRMAEKIPGDKIKVAESGINSVANIRLFKENGFKGFLIGENFMKKPDPGKAFENFIIELGYFKNTNLGK
ncbi:MAG: indole-3-glycerol phosphate synthase TrpC [Chitinophagaceae bacterium]